MVLRRVGLRSLTTLILKAESFLGPGSVPPECSLAKQASGGTVYEPVRALPSRLSARCLLPRSCLPGQGALE